MSAQRSQGQKAGDDTFHLLYWPGVPGRGEFVRLALEYSGATYTDTAQIPNGASTIVPLLQSTNTGDAANPPPFAPPILRHQDLTVGQTPNILLYLGPKLNLSPSMSDDPAGALSINGLTLTVLDGLSNEPHETHHPVAIGLYYEDQRDEAKRRAEDYRSNRLPKFLAYFERVLNGAASKGGKYLYGGALTYADLVLFQSMDGVIYGFPKAMEALKKSGEYEKVFALYERVKGDAKLKEYLASERRQKYGLGIWRHYPELDA